MPAITHVEIRRFSAKHKNANRNWLVLHLCASIINFEIQEYHAEFYSDHYFTVFDGFPRQSDGYVTLSDAPGLGLEINEDEIAAHPPFAQITSSGGTVKGI